MAIPSPAPRTPASLPRAAASDPFGSAPGTARSACPAARRANPPPGARLRGGGSRPWGGGGGPDQEGREAPRVGPRQWNPPRPVAGPPAPPPPAEVGFAPPRLIRRNPDQGVDRLLVAEPPRFVPQGRGRV